MPLIAKVLTAGNLQTLPNSTANYNYDIPITKPPKVTKVTKPAGKGYLVPYYPPNIVTRGAGRKRPQIGEGLLLGKNSTFKNISLLNFIL